MTPILIKPLVYNKIMAYASVANDLEISGFARFNTRTKIIDKIHPLVEQKCTGGDTEINIEMQEQIVLAGNSAEYNVWWHSHAGMSCFWSATDKDFIDNFMLTLPYIISIVVNNSGDYKCRVDIGLPHRMYVEDVPLSIHNPLPDAEMALIRKDVKDKVKDARSKVVNHRDRDVEDFFYGDLPGYYRHDYLGQIRSKKGGKR